MKSEKERKLEHDIEEMKCHEKERLISDDRYSFKWVEKAVWSGIGIGAVALLSGVLRLILK